MGGTDMTVLSVGRTRFFSVTVAAVILLSSMMALSVSFLSNTPDRTVTRDQRSDVSTPTELLRSTSHVPITVSGNAGFNGPNASTGVTRGSGTPSDPYVIEGWAIGSGPSTWGAMIFIGYTDVHFVIQDCYFYSSGSFDYGVYLDGCSNGVIRRCGCSVYRGYGILLDGSSNNIIADNDCSSNEYGIYLRPWDGSCCDNILINNTCGSNDYDGIFVQGGVRNSLINNTCSAGYSGWGVHLDSAQDNRVCNNTGVIVLQSSSTNIVCNNTCTGANNRYCGILLLSSASNSVFNNTCSGVQYGVFLQYSSGNILANNTCSDNQDGGIYIYFSINCALLNNEIIGNGILLRGEELIHFASHEIDSTNTADGKVIYYYKNQKGITVPSGAGQVLIANCSNVRIENQKLTDVPMGIELAFCDRADVSCNNCSNNSWCSIYLFSSTNINVLNNTCIDNSGYDCCGISLSCSSNNTLVDNICSNIRRESYYGYGISLSSSNGNVLVGNNCSDNLSGLRISYSNSNTLRNNNCLGNDYGMHLVSSNNNTISSNNCSDNFNGMLIDGSSNNTVCGNSIWNNTGYGVFIRSGSFGNKVWNNTFIDNNGASDTYDASQVQAGNDGTVNWWNSTDGYGNYWSDWTTPDDDPRYGIVDFPYDIAGSAGAKDHYPLTAPQVPTEPIPELGMMPFTATILLAIVVLAEVIWRRRNS
jgi:parallel beta-helix repeat protein